MRRTTFTTDLNVSLVVASRRLPRSALPRTITVISPHHTSSRDPFGNLYNTNITFGLYTTLSNYPPRRVLRCYNSLTTINAITSIVPLAKRGHAVIGTNLHRLRGASEPNFYTLLRRINLTNGPIATRGVDCTVTPHVGTTNQVSDTIATLRLILYRSRSQTIRLTRGLDSVGVRQRRARARVIGTTRRLLSTRPRHLRSQIVLL